jgi:DNA repair exonuclease SbcCD ATPase subunit
MKLAYYSNEEIDKYIKEEKIKSEIYDYVFHNIYPESLSKNENSLPIEIIISRANQKFPKLSEIPSNKIENIVTPDYEFKNVEQKLTKIENLLKNIKEDDKNKENNQNNKNNNECPICLENINNKSYFTGSCGHIFCAKCICINLNHNIHTGKLCPLCRVSIL